MKLERDVGGRVISTKPLITFSKRSQDVPVGIASVRPEAFRGREALHLIGTSYTLEPQWSYESLALDLRAIAKELPTSRFVVAANTEFEAYQLSTLGIPSMLANQAVFIDETVFRPLAPTAEQEETVDAVYNARLAPGKRHELAREVRSLGLIYNEPLDGRDHFEKTRAALPHARFINHEAGGGAYKLFNAQECNGQLNRARVGLALSKEEGMMRAAIEYLLCGLPVVSTQSLGGRDRYLAPPFARLTGDDPREIAAAVALFVGRQMDKRAVRAHAVRILNFERHNYVVALNRLVKETFGIENRFPSFDPFRSRGFELYRSADDFIAEIDR